MQISQRLLKLPLIIIALSPTKQKLCILRITFNSPIVLLNCFQVLLEGVVTAADAVQDAPVLVAGCVVCVLEFYFFLFGCLKIHDGILKPF